MPGAWKRYYQRWHHMTGERIDPAMMELVPPLRVLAPPAQVVDKSRYSPFTERNLSELLRQRRIDTLVITGGETDVCVLATVLDAVDRGYRVVLAADALCSSSDETHDSLLALYGNRFSQQIEVAVSEEILAGWR
jgi:nicotinamidase-related amidase